MQPSRQLLLDMLAVGLSLISVLCKAIGSHPASLILRVDANSKSDNAASYYRLLYNHEGASLMKDGIHGFLAPDTQNSLSQLRDRYYAAFDHEQEGKLFTFCAESQRQEHDMILQYARPVLAEYNDSELLILAATMVLLHSLQPVTHKALAEYFDEETASFVTACFLPVDRSFGDGDSWELSLQKLAEASFQIQLVRLALLFGQVKYSPQAVTHFPFWYREAEVIRNVDPSFRQYILSYIETAWDASENG